MECDISGIRGVEIGVRDVAAAADFYTRIWRLERVAERSGAVYLRGAGAHHPILALHPRPAAALLCINLAAADPAAVERLHARATTAEPREISTPEALAEPGGGYGFSLVDPEGRVLRIVAGGEGRPTGGPDAKQDGDQPLKITHVVLNTPKQEDAADFWVRAFGFRVSDRSLLTFIRCGSDHHSVAFHPGDRSTLHHIAFEMRDLDAVMRGAGRMRDAGFPVEWGVGRHGPGNNVFTYFVGPEEFVIEYTAEIEQVTDATPVRTPGDWAYPPGHSDLWGATSPPSARMKAAQTRIGFAPGLFRP